MRDYFYLTELNKFSPTLTLDYALHLGATGKLRMYTFVDSWATLNAFETGEKRGDEKFYLRLEPSTLAELEQQHTTWVSQPESVRKRTATLPSSIGIDAGFIDEKVDGLNLGDTPFFEKASTPARVRLRDKFKQVITLRMSEILCWEDDLKRLAIESHIPLREPETSIGPNPEKPVTKTSDTHSLERALEVGELPHLEALMVAWRLYWKNADRNDRSACPKKDDVKAYLMKKGLSAKTADAGATIIKPQWASEKGW